MLIFKFSHELFHVFFVNFLFDIWVTEKKKTSYYFFQLLLQFHKWNICTDLLCELLYEKNCVFKKKLEFFWNKLWCGLFGTCTGGDYRITLLGNQSHLLIYQKWKLLVQWRIWRNKRTHLTRGGGFWLLPSWTQGDLPFTAPLTLNPCLYWL